MKCKREIISIVLNIIFAFVIYLLLIDSKLFNANDGNIITIHNYDLFYKGEIAVVFVLFGTGILYNVIKIINKKGLPSNNVISILLFVLAIVNFILMIIFCLYRSNDFERYMELSANKTFVQWIVYFSAIVISILIVLPSHIIKGTSVAFSFVSYACFIITFALFICCLVLRVTSQDLEVIGLIVMFIIYLISSFISLILMFVSFILSLKRYKSLSASGESKKAKFYKVFMIINIVLCALINVLCVVSILFINSYS